MPSHTRDASRDRELVLRHQSVPMWDSSDPERAPPPLPMNPSSTSPATKGNVSPNIQAVAANFAEKPRDNGASPYTINPMPPKSPEKSLIKGQFHKRMQSLQNADTRSDFFNYLENRSPERPLRASILDSPTKLPEKSPTKVEINAPAENRDGEKDMTNLLISNRYLSKPILGESTPPSATMLALQNMQLPTENDTQPQPQPQPRSNSDPFLGPSLPNGSGIESLSGQIHSLTDIASNLQREMANLSRRSKDNATDLVSLKAATNARDEDIRKSLRDLSSNLASRFLENDGAARWDFGAFMGSENGINPREPDSSPNSKKSYSAPRMSSPNPFASIEREICGSPTPISDGSASIALLEKVLREMATKEGQEKINELVEEIKSRPTFDTTDTNTDATTTKMLEEILNIVRADSDSKALIRSGVPPLNFDKPRSKSFDPEQAFAPDMELFDGDNAVADRPSVEMDRAATEEMLAIMRRVKSSVIEGGGMTNEVKALVRELRGEVLGMGRDLARKLEEVETTRSAEDPQPPAPSQHEISAIVNESLHDLREQLSCIVNENRHHSSALSEFRAAVDGDQIYSIVRSALEELELPQPQLEPQGAAMQKEEILETVRQAWETYKPEIELQNFGLERDEILECLSEGLKAYQPQHEEAVTYDQVLAAVEAGMQSFGQPPSITREEIIQTIRESIENTQQSGPRALEDDHLRAIREEVLQAVTESVASQNALTRETLNSGLGRDEILRAMADGLETHFSSSRSIEQPHVTKEDVTNAINDAFASQNSALTPSVPPPVSREEVLNAIAEGMENQSGMTREIELNKDDLMDAISSGLHEAAHSANFNVGEQVLERLEGMFENIKADFNHCSAENGRDAEQILHTVKDGFDVVRKEVEGYAVTATEASGKHEIMDTVKEGFRLLQADMEKTITDTAMANARPGNPDTPELLDAMEKEFEHLRQTISSLLIRSNVSSEKDEILDAIRDIADNQQSTADKGEVAKHIKQEFETLRETINMSLVRAEPSSDKDEILAVIRENLEAFRQESAHAEPSSHKDEIIAVLQEKLEGFRQENARALPSSTNDKDEIIAALRESLESFRQDTVRAEPSSDKDEIIAALRESIDALRQDSARTEPSSDKDEIITALRESLESFRQEGVHVEPSSDKDEIIAALRESIDALRQDNATRTEPSSDKDEIIAALQESLEAFREDSAQTKDATDSILTPTDELIDAFQDGVGTIRGDLAKLLERPVEFDTSELLDTLKEGLNSLKIDVEMLRKAQRDAEEIETTRGGELMLANQANTHQPNIGHDLEGLKVLISQLQVKVEAIEAAPRTPQPSEDSLKKEHLDEVLVGLHELQSSVTGIVARQSPTDETAARKEDTDAIETLLRNTKAQLDELVFPPTDELAKAEQLGSLESVIKETKDAITELSTRLEAEGPTKSEIGTLESLMKDIWLALDDVKGKEPQGEGEDTDKLAKSDLQTVEAMIFEVKTQIDELKLPDAETLPTKTEIQDLSALVTEFRQKTEAENELTAQGFDARKVEHAGLAEKIEEAKAVVEGLGEEVKSKLDGSSEGLSQLKELLEGLTASAETFTTVENIKELTDLINREFERARGEQDAGKLEKEERDAAASVKHDETRAAIIVELGAKIDEKLGEVMTKYDEAQTAMESKFSETEERDNTNLEAVTNTKALAEDIKLVIGAMGNSVNETCERISVDTKAFFEKVDVSYNKMEEMQNEVKTHQEQANAAADRLESQLHEFHPQVLESIQEILSIVGQHYDHSQKSTQDLKTDLSALPSTIPSMLPALPAPEPEKYDDTQVHEKLDNLLSHAKGSQVQEALDILVERVTNDQVHDKLEQLLNQTTSTNGQVYEKLNELLGHAETTNGPIHDKLDTLIEHATDSHATNSDQSVTQMMKLDEMHKDIMETSRRMNEMFATQSALVAEDTERKRREAEEAAIALERRNAQKEQVESEIVDLREEKDSLLKMISTLKSEKEDLVKQNTKLGKEVSGLEMALDLRHEEMQVMEERADSLEKRILEGVLDHARSVLLSRPNSMQGLNMKKTRSSRARRPSAASNASTVRDARSILGSGVGLALKKRGAAASQSGSGGQQPNGGKERRILSLSNVTANRGTADRQVSASSGFTNLKRSHSVKSNLSQRKASWGGRSSAANKENDIFPEEDENQSGGESDTGMERRTSYGGNYAADRRVSAASSIGPGRSVKRRMITWEIWMEQTLMKPNQRKWCSMDSTVTVDLVQKSRALSDDPLPAFWS
ncbi:hypothetical protein ASPWEDRAFT_38234 [Aspergillus wentii DTO 134E9]|uniref:Chromosome segregation ATPase family protein n=1 Tax=Aspergillus wentii DTO 134E9 TaxID=1073089 RepID=A0A1L9RP36_ASPWE|nr:uncharacterized protein ASPWEDRAFT_38234 [Aspergillus wentii DTO 134E9]OJJ36633.1 hypothetical protein ASPWEDRAFT_38234 [Aspergillus wentii DTO 134E9]